MTPLFWAARHGNLRAVRALLESGEDPDGKPLLVLGAQRGPCETSPLLTAIPERLEIVRALLQAGADPNGVEDNFSPLWFAVCDGSKESHRGTRERGRARRPGLTWFKLTKLEKTS